MDLSANWQYYCRLFGSLPLLVSLGLPLKAYRSVLGRSVLLLAVRKTTSLNFDVYDYAYVDSIIVS